MKKCKRQKVEKSKGRKVQKTKSPKDEKSKRRKVKKTKSQKDERKKDKKSIAVHCCPLFPIVFHCYPLLSFVVHCYPFLVVGSKTKLTWQKVCWRDRSSGLDFQGAVSGREREIDRWASGSQLSPAPTIGHRSFLFPPFPFQSWYLYLLKCLVFCSVFYWSWFWNDQVSPNSGFSKSQSCPPLSFDDLMNPKLGPIWCHHRGAMVVALTKLKLGMFGILILSIEFGTSTGGI